MDSALDSRQEPKRCKHNTEALDHEATTTRARANEERRMRAPSNRSRPVRARSSRAGRRRRGSAELNRGRARQGCARIDPGRRRAKRWRPRSNGEDEGEVAAARSCAQPRVLRHRREGVRVGGAWARRGDGGRGRVRRNYHPNLQRIKIIRANNLLRNPQPL